MVVLEKIEDWSKRDDHRHHALDAFVVACTSRSMVQRLNNLNQLKTEQEMALKDASAYGLAKRLRQFEPPYTRLREMVKDALQDVLVSYKTGKRVAVWSRSVIKLPRWQQASTQNINTRSASPRNRLRQKPPLRKRTHIA